jgi:hypothetical protein
VIRRWIGASHRVFACRQNAVANREIERNMSNQSSGASNLCLGRNAQHPDEHREYQYDVNLFFHDETSFVSLDRG